MALNILPEGLILKIGEFLSPKARDLIAFSHTNSRIFQIFSKENFIWETMMDSSDRAALHVNAELVGGGGDQAARPKSAKEIFFQRTRLERNWRRNNFKILQTYDVPTADDVDQTLSYSSFYRDFFAHVWYDWIRKEFKVTWVDLAADICTVKAGTLQKPIFSTPEEDCVQVSAATSTILVFLLKNYARKEADRVGMCSLFTVDIRDANNLQVMWQRSIRSSCKWDVSVANCKIYRLDTSVDGSKVFKVLSAITGQYLASWSNEILGKVNKNSLLKLAINYQLSFSSVHFISFFESIAVQWPPIGSW